MKSAQIIAPRVSSSSMYKLACGIVTYKSDPEMVAHTIRSLRESFPPIHITVIDNNSGEEYLEELRPRIPGVNILSTHHNGGYGYGHNIGIKNAPPCEYYLIMNPDVFVKNGAIERLIHFMDENPNYGLASPKVLNPDGSLQHLNKRLPTLFDLFSRRFFSSRMKQIGWIKRKMGRYIMLDIGYESVAEIPFVSGCFMFYRKNVLDRAGLFDEDFFMYLEDTDLSRRTGEISKNVFVPEAVIIHQWSRSAHHKWKFTWIMIRSVIHYFRKWGWKFF